VNTDKSKNKRLLATDTHGLNEEFRTLEFRT